MSVKYIILGKTGYIAQAIAKELQSREIAHVTLSRNVTDYTNPKILHDWLRKNHDSGLSTKNAVIINCAGFIGKPNVDACEDKLKETIDGNVILPHQLALSNMNRQQPFVHISSGCIYNGYDKDYTEECPSDFDFTNGSVYSGTKAMAEEVIRKTTDQHYILRLRIPFDEHASPRNYITKMLTYNKLLNATNSMSHRGDFAKAVIDLLEMDAPYGTYNITNPGSIDTKTVVSMMRSYLNLKHDIEFYDDMSSFMKDVKAPRSNCVLSTNKLQSLVNIRDIHEAMESTLKQYAAINNNT